MLNLSSFNPVTHEATTWMRLVVGGVGSKTFVATLGDTGHDLSP